MSGECRFDLAMLAIEDLRKYIEVSSLDENTSSVIERVKKAVDSLEKIELQIPQDRAAKKGPKAVSASLFMAADRFEKLKVDSEDLRVFLKKHEKGIIHLETAVSVLRELRRISHTIHVIDKRIRAAMGKEKEG